MPNTNFVNWPNFAQIKEMFKEHFIMDQREDGVVTVRMHVNGGPLIWSMELHDAIGKMFEKESWIPEGVDPVNTRYDHMFIDGRRMLIAQIQDVEVPTLGVLSGSGGHTELALCCDLAIAADDITILDPHMLVGNVPGDGIHSCFLQLMPYRQAVWYLMTGDKMTAAQALQFGLVSEIVPRERLMDRAYEIADLLMAQNRFTRRLATQVMRRGWKQRIVDDLDMTFGTECFGMYCDSHEHSNMQSMNDYIGIKPNYKGAIDLPENVDRAAVAKRAHEAS